MEKLSQNCKIAVQKSINNPKSKQVLAEVSARLLKESMTGIRRICKLVPSSDLNIHG